DGRWIVGENQAWGSGESGSPDAVFAAWMASSGHRANILRSAFRNIGLAVIQTTPELTESTGATYVVDFGGQLPRGPRPRRPRPRRSLPRPARRRVRAAQRRLPHRRPVPRGHLADAAGHGGRPLARAPRRRWRLHADLPARRPRIGPRAHTRDGRARRLAGRP